jgi:hypothetical protein
VLLEVVLALVLFVGAAAVISGGLQASLAGLERMRLNAHATDLAVSVLAELQLGLRSLDKPGPEPFEEPFENWSWEVVTSPAVELPGEEKPLQRVEVIVRHLDPPLVFRLTQLLRPEAPAPGVE